MPDPLPSPEPPKAADVLVAVDGSRVLGRLERVGDVAHPDPTDTYWSIENDEITHPTVYLADVMEADDAPPVDADDSWGSPAYRIVPLVHGDPAVTITPDGRLVPGSLTEGVNMLSEQERADVDFARDALDCQHESIDALLAILDARFPPDRLTGADG